MINNAALAAPIRPPTNENTDEIFCTYL